MHLPPELLDEIINHLPDDKIYLRNCSLVAKSWVYPSRRRLFNTINFSGDADLKLWLGTISPTNVGVLQHVRSLQCQIAESPSSPHPPVDLLRDYSPSLCQLERLTLYAGFLPPLAQISTYSTFQHALSYLSLQCCIVTTNGVVTLVNYFPNLAHLDLSELCHWADDLPTPPFSRPLQKLTLTEFSTDDSVGLVDQLLALRPQCEEIAIGMFWSSCPSLAQHVIDGVEASVKRLCLESDLRVVGNPLSLSNCRELCELKIYAPNPRTVELNLISSITSTKIQKIIFTQVLSPQESSASDRQNWTKLDGLLCRLVDRLEHGLRLEVEFQAPGKQERRGGGLDFRKWLPMFYDKGG